MASNGVSLKGKVPSSQQKKVDSAGGVKRTASSEFPFWLLASCFGVVGQLEADWATSSADTGLEDVLGGGAMCFPLSLARISNPASETVAWLFGMTFNHETLGLWSRRLQFLSLEHQ